MTKTKRKLTPSSVLKQLRAAFQRNLGVGRATASALLGNASLYDKAYELSCLIETMKHLRAHVPGTTFMLRNGISVAFRGKGGPIDRNKWPFIRMAVNGMTTAELWVDIEFVAWSAYAQGRSIVGRPYGKAHELDVVVVRPHASAHPTPHDIIIGVEAKHRLFNKALLKELLGVRREMTLLSHVSHPILNPRNALAWWATNGELPAAPSSGLVLFCSGDNVQNYDDPAVFWGIEMVYHPY